MDKEFVAALIAQGQALADLYNVFKPALPEMLEAYNDVMVETQGLRKALMDTVQGFVVNIEEISANGAVAYYKTLVAGGIEEGIAGILTIEHIKASHNAATAIANAHKQNPSN